LMAPRSSMHFSRKASYNHASGDAIPFVVAKLL
jgi:hypothetical protein